MTITLTNEQRDEYHKTLGKFCEVISNIEFTLFATVEAMSGVDPQILANLITSWRVAATVDIIKRLLELFNYPQEDVTELREALTHLADIESFRNSILHGVVIPPTPALRRFMGKPDHHDFGAELVGTNAHMARSGATAKAIPVSAEILAQAAMDLIRITAHLQLFRYKLLAQRAVGGETLGEREEAEYRQHVQMPWRYKPVPQGSSSRKPRG